MSVTSTSSLLASLRAQASPAKPYGMECQIPRCEPRILPLVWHGKDVAAIEMHPIRVAPTKARCWRRRLLRIPVQPDADVTAVELLAPDHSGEGLPLHEPCVLIGLLLLELAVILIGFAGTGSSKIDKVCKWLRLAPGGEPEANPRFPLLQFSKRSAPPLWCLVSENSPLHDCRARGIRGRHP
jgi:hypothetical protein